MVKIHLSRLLQGENAEESSLLLNTDHVMCRDYTKTTVSKCRRLHALHEVAMLTCSFPRQSPPAHLHCQPPLALPSLHTLQTIPAVFDTTGIKVMLRGCKQQGNSFKRHKVHERIIYMHLSDASIYSCNLSA